MSHWSLLNLFAQLWITWRLTHQESALTFHLWTSTRHCLIIIRQEVDVTNFCSKVHTFALTFHRKGQIFLLVRVRIWPTFLKKWDISEAERVNFEVFQRCVSSCLVLPHQVLRCVRLGWIESGKVTGRTICLCSRKSRCREGTWLIV